MGYSQSRTETRLKQLSRSSSPFHGSFYLQDKQAFIALPSLSAISCHTLSSQ